MQKYGTWYKRRMKSPTIGGPDEFSCSGVLTSGSEHTAGLYTDLRTPEQIIDLCCPPQLIMAIVSEFEGPD